MVLPFRSGRRGNGRPPSRSESADGHPVFPEPSGGGEKVAGQTAPGSGVVVVMDRDLMGLTVERTPKPAQRVCADRAAAQGCSAGEGSVQPAGQIGQFRHLGGRVQRVGQHSIVIGAGLGE